MDISCFWLGANVNSRAADHPSMHTPVPLSTFLYGVNVGMKGGVLGICTSSTFLLNAPLVFPSGAAILPSH